jgi:hypothetical protein
MAGYFGQATTFARLCPVFSVRSPVAAVPKILEARPSACCKPLNNEHSGEPLIPTIHSSKNSLQGRHLSAWAEPLIPKIHFRDMMAAGSLNDIQTNDIETSNVEANDVETSNVEASDFETSYDEDGSGEGNNNTASSLDASEISRCNSEEGETVSDSKDTSTASGRSRRRRRKVHQQGLFVAELSNGLHISLGPCWATLHHNILHAGSSPVCVIHMPLPIRTF